jgi:dTDP-4-dehydrorhamnose reductase
MRTHVLLLGRTGQVGTALAKQLDQVTAPSSAEFNLMDSTRDRIERLLDEAQPSVVINCAAYTAVDKAESHTEVANQINGAAVGLLAEVSAVAGVPFVSFSTDYVFDGRSTLPYVESSTPNPINVYGQSKLIGERLAIAANPRTLIIRTSWVISGTHGNFVATMLRLAQERSPTRVVNDQHGSPTFADDLAVASIEAIETGATGLLHLTNQGATTWFDLARAALTEAMLDPDLVSPCTSADYPTPAARPAYTVLESERRTDLGINPLPHWEDSLPAVVKQLVERQNG